MTVKEIVYGLITVADCCRELGISRSTWYDRARKVG